MTERLNQDQTKNNNKLDRRSFLKVSTTAGAGILISQMLNSVYAEEVVNATPAAMPKGDDLNIALLGAGAQGQVLMDACLRIPNIRFKAVCDIWAEHNLKRVSRILKAYKHEVNSYTDYREMLANEKDIDAVIIATPDFWHAKHTIASLNAGLNVYCEKEMSNTLEGAKQMVLAARQTGKLLQIGHQRRSNPRYRYCYEKLIEDAHLLGSITTMYGQWNRSKASCEDLGYPEKAAIPDEILKKYGFESMQQFCNWRWYKGLGGGPIVDLGSHQIDIFCWFLGEATPKSVVASGGTDYWKGRQWYDNAIAIYEFETPTGIARAVYQTITTNSNGGYYETFMGDEGTIMISESAARGEICKEGWVPAEKWDQWVKKGYLLAPIEKEEKKQVGAVLDVRETKKPPSYALPIKFNDPYHKPHLQNFFDAIRGKATLNCPAEVAYATAVAVLKVNDAIAGGSKVTFNPTDFKV